MKKEEADDKESIQSTTIEEGIATQMTKGITQTMKIGGEGERLHIVTGEGMMMIDRIRRGQVLIRMNKSRRRRDKRRDESYSDYDSKYERKKDKKKQKKKKKKRGPTNIDDYDEVDYYSSSNSYSDSDSNSSDYDSSDSDIKRKKKGLQSSASATEIAGSDLENISEQIKSQQAKIKKELLSLSQLQKETEKK